MAFNVELAAKNQTAIEKFRVNSPNHGWLVEKKLEEITSDEAVNKQLIGTAAGMSLLHCFFLGCSYGWDVIFLNKVNYFKYSNNDNKDYPISVDFYK